jgi:hypothetical protein
MRTVRLIAALAVGAPLVGCSKPEPAAGAPSPDAVVVDSSKTTADSSVTAALPDSSMKDSAAAAMPDSAKPN